jgi:hypothetical protein
MIVFIVLESRLRRNDNDPDNVIVTTRVAVAVWRWPYGSYLVICQTERPFAPSTSSNSDLSHHLAQCARPRCCTQVTFSTCVTRRGVR